MKKNYIFTLLIVSLMTSCQARLSSESNKEPESEETLMVTTDKSSFTIGDKIEASDFVVKDADGNVLNGVQIKNLDLFCTEEQTINFFDESGLNFGIYKLRLMPRTSLKVLAIGNSWIQDTMKMIFPIAKSMGLDDVHFVNMFLSGATLAQHYGDMSSEINTYVCEEYKEKKESTMNINIDYGLELDDWDFIVYHNTAYYATVSSAYNSVEDIKTYAGRYYPAKSVELFNMPWALHDTSGDVQFIKKFNGDQMLFYETIVNVTREEVEKREYLKGIIPSGTAMQNLRTSFVGQNVNRDPACHLNDNGRFVMGLNWVSYLTGIDASYCTFDGGLGDRYLSAAIESVQNAMKNPYSVTESKIK